MIEPRGKPPQSALNSAKHASVLSSLQGRRIRPWVDMQVRTVRMKRSRAIVGAQRPLQWQSHMEPPPLTLAYARHGRPLLLAALRRTQVQPSASKVQMASTSHRSSMRTVHSAIIGAQRPLHRHKPDGASPLTLASLTGIEPIAANSGIQRTHGQLDRLTCETAASRYLKDRVVFIGAARGCGRDVAASVKRPTWTLPSVPRCVVPQ